MENINEKLTFGEFLKYIRVKDKESGEMKPLTLNEKHKEEFEDGTD